MYIDSHAHLTSNDIYDDIEGVLQRAQGAGVSQIINICTDISSLERGLSLHKKYPWVLNAASSTPHDVEKEGEDVFPIVAAAAKNGSLIAVGETGLDYYYEHSNRDIQKDFLKRYLQLALESDLPVIIHCRDAFVDFFDILDRHYLKNGQHAPGVLHCFTGSVDEALEIIKRGWYLSLSGIVTFKKSAALREVAKLVPLDQLLIETDAPYLAPQKFRGKKNEPSYLPNTAEVIAAEQNITLEQLAAATKHNAQKLFRLMELA